MGQTKNKRKTLTMFFPAAASAKVSLEHRMPKNRNRRKKSNTPLPAKGRVVPMSDATHAALTAQRAAFVEKFGREPGPGDPVFFDPTKDVPTQLSGEDMRQQLTETMRQAGIDEAKIAAFLKGL